MVQALLMLWQNYDPASDRRTSPTESAKIVKDYGQPGKFGVD